MKNKTIIAGLAGGVVFFLLGWLIYGMLLGEFMASNYNSCANRAEADMIWWSLILSNFLWGFVLAVILSWANTRGFMSGMQRGLLIGILIASAYDFSMHSMLTVFLTTNALILDIVMTGVMCGIVGGIVGMIIGPEKNDSPNTL
jgi:hypothetical protein